MTEEQSIIPRLSRRPLVPGPSQQPPPNPTAALQAPNVTVTVRDEPVNNVPREYRPSTVGNIAKGIAGVMAEIGTIAKSGTNKFHNYKYVTLDDLLFALTPLMGKHGIVVIQNEVETKTVENRMVVTYEFSIIHSSGEVWPERPRFSGMSLGRDSKGNWDDKAINKCHSAARKYFLLSLFQVPSGDFDDADPGPATSLEQPTPRKRIVPGPSAIPSIKPGTGYRFEGDPRKPHKIILGGGQGPEAWASAYLTCIEKAKSPEELQKWNDVNNDVLQTLNDRYPDVYNQIDGAATRRLLQLDGTMPEDTQEAMNWIAQHLLDINTYEAAEAFWNQFVAPNEARFDEVDWELLMKEWERLELRLNPPENDEPPDAA